MASHFPQPAREVAAAISKAARRLPGRAPQQVAAHDGTILQMFWRCPPLFDGVIALLERGLPEEALFLGRSLFDESLQLEELAAGPKRQRIGLVVGRMKHSIKRNRRLTELAIDVGLEKNLTREEIGQRLDNWERKVDGYATRHRVEPQSFMSPWRAARRFGRSEEYWTRELAHHMVHGNDASMLYRRSKTASDTLLVTNRTTNPKLVTGAMCFAGRSMLRATTAAAKMFSWRGEDALNALLGRVKALEPI